MMLLVPAAILQSGGFQPPAWDWVIPAQETVSPGVEGEIGRLSAFTGAGRVACEPSSAGSETTGSAMRTSGGPLGAASAWSYTVRIPCASASAPSRPSPIPIPTSVLLLVV